MNYSIFHIETDLDCRVLKYGNEVCVAAVGTDTVLHLIKGRHKLTFESTENAKDSYSIIFEVPENGIEDFVEVELKSIRNARLEKEQKELMEKRAQLEKERLENEKRIRERIEQERRERELYEEQKKKQEEKERANMLRIWNMDKIHMAIQEAINLSKEMSDVANYEYCGLKWIQEDKLYYLSKNGTRLTPSKYKKVGRFSCGLARVTDSNNSHYYVNEKGEPIFNDGNFVRCNHFYNGKAVVYPQRDIAVVIDITGIVEKVYKNIISNNSDAFFVQSIEEVDERDRRSLILRTMNEITREIIYTIKIGVIK